MRAGWGLVVVAALAGPVLAQDQPPLETGISVEHFQPPSGPQSLATLEGTGVLAHLNYSAGALFHAASGGVTVFAVDGDDNLRTRQEVVQSQRWLDVTAALGFKGRFQFGVVVPILISLRGEGIDETANPDTADHLNETALGDVRVDGKWLATGGSGTETSVSLAASVTVPSSGGKDFVGEDLPTFRPRVIIEDTLGKVTVVVNLGAVFRSPKTVLTSERGQELAFGVGAGIPAGKSLGLFAEVFGHNGFSNDLDSTPVEIDGGLKLRRGSFQLMAGGGAGIVRGVGAPDWRVFAGVGFSPRQRPDSDRDGIPDDSEGRDFRGRSCLNQPEDLDDYEDSDGCPELDNDGDDIDDTDDKCPKSMEDVDGFEDQDGCPDRDDDGDGVDDLKDACPGGKEDGVAPGDKDGCPAGQGDSDKDGVPDAADKCPEQAEDKDGFEDDDGCVDADNDGDGIADKDDGCRAEAEDKDGFADSDGCPELDNDRDGVLDANDRCDSEPETINGVKDDDGCPDTGGKQLVSLGEDGALVLAQPVLWNNKDAPAPKAKDLLDQIARVMLRADADVERWSIVVAAEPAKGASDEQRAEAATFRAQALALALVARGVPEAKLETRGLAAPTGSTTIMIAKRRSP